MTLQSWWWEKKDEDPFFSIGMESVFDSDSCDWPIETDLACDKPIISWLYDVGWEKKRDNCEWMRSTDCPPVLIELRLSFICEKAWHVNCEQGPWRFSAIYWVFDMLTAQGPCDGLPCLHLLNRISRDASHYQLPLPWGSPFSLSLSRSRAFSLLLALWRLTSLFSPLHCVEFPVGARIDPTLGLVDPVLRMLMKEKPEVHHSWGFLSTAVYNVWIKYRSVNSNIQCDNTYDACYKTPSSTILFMELLHWAIALLEGDVI